MRAVGGGKKVEWIGGSMREEGGSIGKGLGEEEKEVNRGEGNGRRRAESVNCPRGGAQLTYVTQIGIVGLQSRK
jgi:hypothetical protein